MSCDDNPILNLLFECLTTVFLILLLSFVIYAPALQCSAKQIVAWNFTVVTVQVWKAFVQIKLCTGRFHL